MLKIKRQIQYALNMVWNHRKLYYPTLGIVTLMLLMLSLFVLGADVYTYNSNKQYIGLNPNLMFVTYSNREAPPQSDVLFFNEIEKEAHSFDYYQTFSMGSYYYDELNKNPIFNIHFIDQNFFENYTLRDGEIFLPMLPKTLTPSFASSFVNSNSVIITQQTSVALFGTNNAIGSYIMLDAKESTSVNSNIVKYEVVGIVENEKTSKDRLAQFDELEIFLHKNQIERFDNDELRHTKAYVSDEIAKLSLISQTEGIKNAVFSQRMIAGYRNRIYSDTILVYSIMLVIAVVCQLTVFTAFQSVFRQRINEFGILRALGSKKIDVFFMQSIEVMVLMISAVVLSLFACIAIIWITIKALTINNGYTLTFYINFNRFSILLIFEVILSFVCIILNAIASTKDTIIDSIR